MRNPLFKMVSRLKTLSYYREIIQISYFAVIAIVAFLIVEYKATVWKLTTSPTGVVWLTIFLAGLVLILTIGLFYHMTTLKYNRKT